jgi:[ribosomal protein S5]-alanine N-acetyltransferase
MQNTYETDRLILRVLDESEVDKVLDYLIRNRDFFNDFEPIREDEFYTVEYQSNQLKTDMGYINGKGMLRVWMFLKDNPEKIVGQVTFYNIVPYAFSSCHIGYKSDKDVVNKGLMTEGIIKGIQIMFDNYGLHRIEAYVMKQNKSSIRVLEKTKFLYEGIAKQFLEVNGKWEDHMHYCLVNDKCS